MNPDDKQLIIDLLELDKPGTLGGSLKVTYDFEKASPIIPYLCRNPSQCDCNDIHCPHKSSNNPLALWGLGDKFVINIDLIPYLKKYNFSNAEPEFCVDLISTNVFTVPKFYNNEPTVCEYKLSVTDGEFCRAELVIISCKFPDDINVNMVSFVFLGCTDGDKSKYQAQYNNGWWVFDAPLIIKWLYFSRVILIVNNVAYSGHITTKWLSFPKHKFCDNQTMNQKLKNNYLMCYDNGIGHIISQDNIDIDHI